MKKFNIIVNNDETRYLVGHIDRQDLIVSSYSFDFPYTNPNGKDIHELQGKLKSTRHCTFQNSDLFFVLDNKTSRVNIYLCVSKNNLKDAFAEVVFDVSGRYDYLDVFKIEIRYETKFVDLNCSLKLTGNDSYVNTTEVVAYLQCDSVKKTNINRWEYHKSKYNFQIGSPYKFKNSLGVLTDHIEKDFEIDDSVPISIYIDEKYAKEGQTEIKVLIRRLPNGNIYKILPPLSNSIKPSPNAELKIEMRHIRPTVALSPDDQYLFDLFITNNASSKWAKKLNELHIESDSSFLEYKSEPIPSISPNDCYKIQFYLSGGRIKSPLCEAKMITLTVHSDSGVEFIRFQLASKAVNSDYPIIKLIATKALDIDCSIIRSINIYQGMRRVDSSLTLKNISDYELKNACLWLSEKEGIIQFYQEEDCGYVFNSKVSFATIKPKECVKVGVSISEISDFLKHDVLVLAAADYSDEVQSSFSVTRKQKIQAKLEVELQSQCSEVFINGDKQLIANVMLYNNTKGEDDLQKAEQKDLSELSIMNEHDNQLLMFYFGDLEGDKVTLLPLKPNEKRIIYIWFDRKYPDLKEDTFEYYLGCDGVRLSLKGKIDVKNQSADKEAMHIFNQNTNIVYSPIEPSVIVGHIIVAKQSFDDVNKYFDREKEKIVINDPDSGYFFLADDGKHLSQIDITKTEKSIMLVREIAGWENVEMNDIPIPVNYVCEFPKVNTALTGTYNIKPFVQEPLLNILLQDVEKDKEYLLNGLEKMQKIDIVYDCTDSSILLLDKSCVCRLILKNIADIPYANYGIVIDSLKVTSKSCINIPNLKEKYELINGGDDICLSIYLLWNVISENVKKDKKIDDICVGFEFKYKLKTRTTIPSLLKLEINIKLNRVIRDNWYSLDLGTTGIVMSKLVGKDISLLHLKDATDDPSKNIESNQSIISSISILTEADEQTAQIKFCPEKIELKQKAKHVLAPMKFIVGQEHIPFMKNCSYKGIKLENLQKTIEVKELTSDQLVTSTYQNIFAKLMEKDLNSIERLILTYPNTFVPNQIDKIKELLKPKCSFITFVPESDAVVAYYLKKRMNSSDGFPIVGKKGKERILIYDMGAGTLDISYVILKNDGDKYIAYLDKRIGIPVAGNYLDKLIYDVIKDHLVKSDDEKNVKDFIQNVVKPQLKTGVDGVIKEEEGERFFKDNILKISDIVNNGKISEYISLCSKEILNHLLGDSWDAEIDTLVYSGRASQFQPLQVSFNELNHDSKWENDTTTISDNYLKYCVSEGAINYCEIFENEKNYGFNIVNKNQYLRIGIIYDIETQNKGRKRVYKELINPLNSDWLDIKPINGTRYMDFEISPISLDLRRAEEIQFVQTVMNPELTEQSISLDKWCFVNKLFTVPIDSIITNDRSNVLLKFVFDRNSQIQVSFNGRELPRKYGNENIEENEFYKESVWPYNINK